jgi:hypothetical protein
MTEADQIAIGRKDQQLTLPIALVRRAVNVAARQLIQLRLPFRYSASTSRTSKY